MNAALLLVMYVIAVCWSAAGVAYTLTRPARDLWAVTGVVIISLALAAMGLLYPTAL